MRFYVEFLMEVGVLVGSSVVYMTQGLTLLPNEKTEQKVLNLQIHASPPGTECHLTEFVEEGRGFPQTRARRP